MKKLIALILATMMVLTAAFALAAPSITVEDLTKEADDAHDAFAPGLPEETEDEEPLYTAKNNEDPEAVIEALTEDTVAAVNALLDTDSAVVSEVVDIELATEEEVEVKIVVASAYPEDTKLAIVLVVGEEQFVFEGTVDAEGAVVFTIPADVAAKIVANGGATVVVAVAE